jgi:hypothetical protein
MRELWRQSLKLCIFGLYCYCEVDSEVLAETVFELGRNPTGPDPTKLGWRYRNRRCRAFGFVERHRREA